MFTDNELILRKEELALLIQSVAIRVTKAYKHSGGNLDYGHLAYEEAHKAIQEHIRKKETARKKI